MAVWIVEQTGTAPDAASVAIEAPHGPVVESLVDRQGRQLTGTLTRLPWRPETRLVGAHDRRPSMSVGGDTEMA